MPQCPHGDEAIAVAHHERKFCCALALPIQLSNSPGLSASSDRTPGRGGGHFSTMRRASASISESLAKVAGESLIASNR